MLIAHNEYLEYRYDAEKLWIEPWGANAFRIRATKLASMPDDDWALEFSRSIKNSNPLDLDVRDKYAAIKNGKIKAVVMETGKLTISDEAGVVLLEEYTRNRKDLFDKNCSALEIEGREFKPIPGTDCYHLRARFESLHPKTEKLYGMGQYQQDCLNLMGHDIEMAHRNSQASIPFVLSSRNYGFLWNNPAIGRAVFGKNAFTFEAYSTTVLDYWIVAGDNPAEIVQGYASVTGTVPMMPEYGLGFWQSKLRYQTQEELLSVAREYRKRDLPISVLVCDFFHWPVQGSWLFSEEYWPDPGAMVRELQDLNIELMVSVWPNVDTRSSNYEEMLMRGLLIQTDRGARIAMDFEGYTIHVDVTNPEARKYLWEKIRRNYYSPGIKCFWLDEAEPEIWPYDFDHYRYHIGSVLNVGNIYPKCYSQAFFEGMTKAGQTNIVNLVRCAWAGSQRFGALVWSGDIASSWQSFRNQLAAGLSMGLCGIPWWTTDIGGFHGGDPNDPEFRELFARWFAWGAFCPVMRLHGDREPKQPQQGTTGGATCRSGAPNEVWSYGEDVLKICKRYLEIREKLRDYTRECMRAAHENGSPIMRPTFYDFPRDKHAWTVESQYMYGPKYLCCPILSPGMIEVEVYLPAGAKWTSFEGQEELDGGQYIKVSCALDTSTMPVFVRR